MKRPVFALLVLLSAPLLLSNTAWAQLDMLRNLTGGGDTTKEIAYFRIKGPLRETPTDLPPLFGSEPPLSLKELLERFKDARHDNNVVAIVIDLQEAAIGLAQLEEIHDALRKFAALDKEVYVHADGLRTLTYAAATGASHISIVPTGDVWLVGIYGETPYLRGALDKLGCVPDFEQFEEFKTAAEPFMRSEPSEQSKKMTGWLLDGLYDGIVALIAKSRGMTPEKTRRLIDNGPYSAEAALKAGLIDSVQHRQDFVAGLKKRYGEHVKVVMDYGKKDFFAFPDDNMFAVFEALMKLFNPSRKVYSTPSVAIVYVEGLIQTGAAERSFFGAEQGAFSTTIRRALDKAAADDSVKAVVLRVDSPGGSALASEIILDATKRVAEKKTLIVSMGNVAGSGGYYVTCGSDMIFASPGTITASIGVIGGKLVTTGMWNKIGVNWYANQRGAMADMMSTARTFTEAQRTKIREYMGSIYEIFKGHVVAARADKLTKPIGQIAGGRVFTGVQAMDLGLVDKLGGLEDAIKFAAKRAGLGEYDVRVIPEPASIFDLFGGRRDKDEFTGMYRRPARSLVDLPLFTAVLPMIERVDPLRAAAIRRALIRVELIHAEGAVTVMPQELLIR